VEGVGDMGGVRKSWGWHRIVVKTGLEARIDVDLGLIVSDVAVALPPPGNIAFMYSPFRCDHTCDYGAASKDEGAGHDVEGPRAVTRRAHALALVRFTDCHGRHSLRSRRLLSTESLNIWIFWSLISPLSCSSSRRRTMKGNGRLLVQI
jgi:hypothetical protein